MANGRRSTDSASASELLPERLQPQRRPKAGARLRLNVNVNLNEPFEAVQVQVQVQVQVSGSGSGRNGETFYAAPFLSPAACLNASALSVLSHVNSGSLLPKCPYAAVFS